MLLEPGYRQSLQAFRALPDHSLVLGGVGSSGMRVGDQVLRSASGEGPFLVQLSREGEPLWATLFCSFGGTYDYEGTLRLSYSNGSLRSLLVDAGELELGRPFSRLTEPLLLGFDLMASDPTDGDGG